MSSARRPPTSSSPSPPPPLHHRSSPTTSSSSSSSSTTATTSHRSPPMSDEDDAVLPPTSTNTNPTTPPSPSPSPPPPSTSAHLHALPPPPLPSTTTTTTTTKTTSFPIREDCWSEEATRTLIEAWGSHYLDLNRGNLRQKHWQEVADAVNGVHAHTKKLHRTDIQCKNRIDTLKKKYKVEKSKVLQSNGRHASTWPFFASLDSLIGDSFIKSNAPPSGTPPLTRKNSVSAKNTYSPATVPAPAPATTVRKEFPVLPPLPSAVPVGPRSKRPAPAMGEETVFRRNFSAIAAAAAAVADDEEDEDESDTSSAAAMGTGPGGMRMRRRRKRGASRKVVALGYRKLAEAIGGFVEIYERVEEAKQRQMVELEKQRMQFAKDLEIQRMKLFMESQVQLEKLKRSKRNSQSDGYL